MAHPRCLNPNPAHIRDRRWNLLAWNQSFADGTEFDQAPVEERNILWLLFTRAAETKLVPDWRELAEIAVAQFRYEAGPYLGEPAVNDMVNALRQRSEEFREWWEMYDVYSAIGSHTEWRHPRAGRLEFERCAMALDGPEHGANQRFVHVLVPLPGTGTADRVATLTSVA